MRHDSDPPTELHAKWYQYKYSTSSPYYNVVHFAVMRPFEMAGDISPYGGIMPM